jgi:transcriptional regulator with GAF, ATPase, and Fis domain
MSRADVLCAGLPALGDAASAKLGDNSLVGLGIVCTEPEGTALFMYADVFGCTGYRAGVDDLPPGFRPRVSGRLEIDAAGFYANPSGLVESRLTQATLPDQFERPARIARVLTLPIETRGGPAILAAAFGHAASAGAADAGVLESVAVNAGRLLDRQESADQEVERLRRLEAVEGLLPALFRTLDVREIFDTLSTITKDVVPHDFASVGMFSDSYTHLTLFAKTTSLSPHEYHGPMPYAPVQTAAWVCRFVRDLPSHPVDGKTDYGTQLGGKSSIRVPIRLDGRLIGALNFTSCEPARYTALDLTIARRVADYVALAVSHQRLAEEGRRAAALEERNKKLEVRVSSLISELDRTGYRRVTGESKAWQQVLTQATKVAATDTTALLLGESGTGKEVVARFLHRASPRSAGPFVALNCAALPEQLLEAELFGYERGAYTGATQSKPGQLEQAAGGTLFLDEVAEMSPSAQAKFLRVLQEREFQRLGGTRVLRTDARVIAATNRDLERAMTQGQFREDLYYRLNVFAIQLPPLRDRSDDILPLTEAFLAEFAQRFGRPPAGVSREARRMLVEYHWPGNVRELHNSLERAAILCEGGLITPEHLAFSARPRPIVPAVPAPAAAPASIAHDPAPPASGDLTSMERTMIAAALEKARFNKSKAAKALGLSRQQLYVRMRRYGLE